MIREAGPGSPEIRSRHRLTASAPKRSERGEWGDGAFGNGDGRDRNHTRGSSTTAGLGGCAASDSLPTMVMGTLIT